MFGASGIRSNKRFFIANHTRVCGKPPEKTFKMYTFCGAPSLTRKCDIVANSTF